LGVSAAFDLRHAFYGKSFDAKEAFRHNDLKNYAKLSFILVLSSDF
jgi:hypothetical protein